MKEEKGRVGKGRKGGWEKREKRLRERKTVGGSRKGSGDGGRLEEIKINSTTQLHTVAPPRLGYAGSDVRGQRSVRGRKPGFGVTRM